MLPLLYREKRYLNINFRTMITNKKTKSNKQIDGQIMARLNSKLGNENSIKTAKATNQKSNIQTQSWLRFVVASIIISGFYVLFVWRFWNYGTEALGLNITVFWLLLTGFFLAIQWKKLTMKSFLWIVPLLIIILSLGIYSTKFTGWISILLLPIIFFIFTTHESHPRIRHLLWSRYFPLTIILTLINFILALFSSSSHRKIQKVTLPQKQLSKNTVDIWRQIIIGVSIFLVLAGFVVIPLLSSADSSFANIFKNFFTWLGHFIDFFTPESFIRLLFFFFGIFVLMGSLEYWRITFRPFLTNKTNSQSAQKNTITIGIVLGGILVLYLIFIILQIKHLFVGALPVDFSKTENFVKSGFWQLVALTTLNILLYAGIYNRQTKIIQRILTIFTFISLFLVFSATQRVFLYVLNYGLSYEKFFAFYTVVFCIFVFLWFLSLIFRHNKPANIIQGLFFLALWMYALATIVPLEKIILTTNLNLTQQEDSRVNINELRMLGFDTLPSIEKNYDLFMREAFKDYREHHEPNKYKTLEGLDKNPEKELEKDFNTRWINWYEKITAQQNNLYKYYSYYYDKHSQSTPKKWYEKNIIELFYTPSEKVNQKINSLPNNNKSSQETSSKDKKKLLIFKDPIHHFSFQYFAKGRINFTDYYNEADFMKKDYSVSVNSINDANKTIFFISYNDKTENKNDTHKSIVSLFEKTNRSPSEYTRTYLPNLSNRPVYITISKNKNDTSYYGLLLRTSTDNILHIGSNTQHPNISLPAGEMSIDEALKLLTPKEDLQQTIKSLRIL